MQQVNSDSIQKFQNLLLMSNQAKMSGTTMVIDKEPVNREERAWLYSYVRMTEKQNVREMVEKQRHQNTLYDKVNKFFARGVPLSYTKLQQSDLRSESETKSKKSRKAMRKKVSLRKLDTLRRK